MSMKPILFNTDMVRALLEDRKTVTRRVVKPQPVCYGPYGVLEQHNNDFVWLADEHYLRCRFCGNYPEYSREGSNVAHHWETPYRPGDILYVRETFSEYNGEYIYQASVEQPKSWNGLWRPSVWMPREAARIFLRVTDVRVERLQDIKPEQLRAEGFHLSFTPSECQRMFDRWGAVQNFEREKEKFASIWDSTIKPADRALYSWDANPWVWVIEFERISREEAVNHAV